MSEMFSINLHICILCETLCTTACIQFVMLQESNFLNLYVAMANGPHWVKMLLGVRQQFLI